MIANVYSAMGEHSLASKRKGYYERRALRGVPAWSGPLYPCCNNTYFLACFLDQRGY